MYAVKKNPVQKLSKISICSVWYNPVVRLPFLPPNLFFTFYRNGTKLPGTHCPRVVAGLGLVSLAQIYGQIKLLCGKSIIMLREVVSET